MGNPNDVPARRRHPEQPAFLVGGVCKPGHRTRTQLLCPRGPLKPTELIMHIRLIAPLATALALLAGCAATINQDGLEQRTA